MTFWFSGVSAPLFPFLSLFSPRDAATPSPPATQVYMCRCGCVKGGVSEDTSRPSINSSPLSSPRDSKAWPLRTPGKSLRAASRTGLSLSCPIIPQGVSECGCISLPVCMKVCVCVWPSGPPLCPPPCLACCAWHPRQVLQALGTGASITARPYAEVSRCSPWHRGSLLLVDPCRAPHPCPH